ncbi:MAG: UvrD-helicase domain-containing protein [Planctomycetota bacterium]
MAERPPKDQEVRDRIVKDLDTSFAVEAGAGTGKTALLTARMIEAVRTGRATLTEIVAITFTERAANELRVRLREELEKLLAGASGGEAERLSEALASLDGAQVSTIHSFAAELLRERPVEAGVDPGFEVAENLRADLLFDDVWARWLRRQLAEENGPLRPAFLAGLTADSLNEFARFLLDNRDLRPAGGEVDTAGIIEEFTGVFVRRVRELDAWMQEVCSHPRCTCRKKCAEAARAVVGVENLPADAQLARAVTISDCSVRSAQNSCKDQERKRACKLELAELNEVATRLGGPAAHSIVCRTAGILREMVEAYNAAKREQALLDFDDLLLKARDLLRDNREVRRYFQRRFKLILIDECQDTDPLQTEIVFFLAENGAKAADWRNAKILPGKLLFVGDPKQSIYRFRRADIEVYDEARRAVARDGQLVEISQNFRSSPSCVRWFNAVFAELIQRPDDGAYQPDYIPLDAWREDAGPAVTVLKPPDGTLFDKIDEARAAEAGAVAAEITAMIGGKDTVLDKETRRPRPVTYGDIALLFRARTGFDIYERALSAAGVPFRAVSGKGFFAKQEVLELRVVLAAAERPFDSVAVVAALRTSLLGVSDDELAAAADGGFDYLARRAGGGPHIDAAFRLLTGWHEARSTSSMSGLVQRVLSETKALELFYLKPGGEQRAANLTKVIDAARAFEQTPGATFGGFVRWLDEMSAAGDEEESSLVGEEGDFVKLITVHKAKGLEFPVVGLADIAGIQKKGIKRVINRRDGTFDIELGSSALNVATIGFEDATAYEALREEAEARRILYVAATRARDRLIVPHFPRKGKPGGYLKYLTDLAADAAAAAGQVETVIVADPAAAKPGKPQAFRIDSSRTPPKKCKNICKDRDKWADDRKELIRKRSAGRKLATASALQEDDYEDFGHAAGEGEVARAVGKAVHAVLEQIDLTTGDGLAALAEEEAQRHGIAGQAALVGQLAANALQMDVVKRAAEANTLYREVPFAVNIGGTILEGKIDLAFDDGSGLEIADYKTDDVAEDRLAEHAQNYRLQVGAYALAAENIFGKRPVGASLLFLRAGREVPVEIDDALLAAVAEKL